MKLIDFKEYSDTFEWDYILHFPIPTASYILNRTGIDVMALKNNLEQQAKGEILLFTRTAKNYIFRNKTVSQRKKIEWLIAHDIETLMNVLEFVLEFIQIAYTSGEYDNIFKLQTNDKLFIPALEMAENNLGLQYNIIIPFVTKYYEGYW